MSFTIKTTIVEQYLRDKWNTVATVETLTDALEEISSPNFTVYDLMVVKVLKKSTIVYTGVQCNGEWISVGRETSLFRILTRTVSNPQVYASILTLWKDYEDPIWLIDTARTILSEEVLKSKSEELEEFIDDYNFQGARVISPIGGLERFKRSAIMAWSNRVRRVIPFDLFLKSLCAHAKATT